MKVRRPDPLSVPDPRWYGRLFDRLGSRYDDLPFTQGTVQEVDFLVPELGLEPGARILDVGCGSGRHAVELAARGFSVTGVDLSLRLLELALERARSRDVVVNLMHADARELTQLGSFDLALSLCEGAFGLLEDDEQNRRVLERMRAALKPGGRLALNALHRAYLESRRERFPGYDPASGYTEYQEMMDFEGGGRQLVHYRDRAFAPEEIGAMVEGAGFELQAVYGCSFGDFGRHAVEPRWQELLVIGSARR